MQAALIVARRRWCHPRLVHTTAQPRKRTLTQSAANDDSDAFSQPSKSFKSRHNASLTPYLPPPPSPDTRPQLSDMSKSTPFRKDGQRGHFSSSSSNRGAAAAKRAMRPPPNPGPLPQPQLDGDVWDLRFIENNYNPDHSIQLSPEVLSNPRHAVSRFMQIGLGANPTFVTTNGYVGRQQYFRYVTLLWHLILFMKYTGGLARFAFYSQNADMARNIASTFSEACPKWQKLLPLPSVHSPSSSLDCRSRSRCVVIAREPCRPHSTSEHLLTTSSEPLLLSMKSWES
jgi:hypothetical protein